MSSGSGIGNGFGAAIAPRIGHKKAGRGREFETERVEEDFGIVSKMQARSFDPAAEVCRKVDRR
jgi:hypothetical protein